MAVDLYFKLDGIEGESAVDPYKNQIKLLTWQWGASQVSSVRNTGGSGAGKVAHRDFSVSTYLDKSTTKLFKSICLGTLIKQGTLYAVKAGDNIMKTPYLVINFNTVFLTEMQLGAVDETPMVTLSFAYNAIAIQYAAQKADGTFVKMGEVTYDLRTKKVA
jgi:type VI secretion system secreted protein Hcp